VLRAQPCGGRIDEIEGWFRFGTNYENGCRLSMRDLQRTVEAAGLQGRGMFYDLYLQDLAGDFTRTFPDRCVCAARCRPGFALVLHFPDLRCRGSRLHVSRLPKLVKTDVTVLSWPITNLQLFGLDTVATALRQLVELTSCERTARDERRLYPVPVMNEALRQRGVAVNAPENQAVNSEQILVRRFFFLDTVTSVEVGGGDTVQGFRLATKFDLRIQLQPGSEGQIYPPKLVLQYVPHHSLVPHS
jgi:hypothetical protein